MRTVRQTRSWSTMKVFLAMNIIAFAVIFGGLVFHSLLALFVAVVVFAAAFAWLGFCPPGSSGNGAP